MSETLFVRLPPGAEPGAALEWVLLDAAGGRLDHGVHVGVVQQPAEDAAEALSASAETASAPSVLPMGRRVVAFVPATEVSVAAVELPARSSSKALQLAPFALEEQLAGDIEQLHFAVGQQEDSGKTPFVVCARAAMERWLAVLDAAGLSPAALVPDFLAVPANPGHTVVWLEGRMVTIRPPGQWPMLLDAEPLEAALELAGVLGAAVPPHVLVYAAEPEHTMHAVVLEALGAQVAHCGCKCSRMGLWRRLPSVPCTNHRSPCCRGRMSRAARVPAAWRGGVFLSLWPPRSLFLP